MAAKNGKARVSARSMGEQIIFSNHRLWCRLLQLSFNPKIHERHENSKLTFVYVVSFVVLSLSANQMLRRCSAGFWNHRTGFGMFELDVRFSDLDDAV